MRISGCVIAKNEEDNIANCIKSLNRVIDEIIVVDTGSEDKTIQIAKELGALVYEQKWENDFSKAKNAALERATGDWIIFLDADEFFDEGSVPNIRTTIENAHTRRDAEGILCSLINIDPGTGRVVDSSHVIRIFRNNKQIRFVNKIHEEVRNKGKHIKYINNSSEIAIIHTGYSPALRIKKARRNLEILLNEPEHEISAYHLATLYFMLQDFDNAYHYADLALSIKTIRENDQLAYKMHFYKIIIAMNFDRANKVKIEALIKDANKKYGKHPEIVKIEAIYLFKEKRYTSAYEKFVYALDCQRKYGRTLGQNNFEGTVYEVYYYMAQILYKMNLETDSFDYYIKAIRAGKHQKEIFRGMFALCRTMPENETIAFLNSIYDMNDEGDVRFLIQQVVDSGLAKIVLYYANIWNNIFLHEDDVLIYAFLAQGNHRNSLEVASLYLRKNKKLYTPLVTTVMILGGISPWSEAGREEDLGEDYRDLIVCFTDSQKYSGSTDAYLSVLTLLINLADRDTIESFLKIADENDLSLLKGVAEHFQGSSQFDMSIRYYHMLFQSAYDENIKAGAAFEMGYCYYKQKCFEDSADWFEKAAQNGYEGNDLMEYMQWITIQTTMN